MSVGFVTTARGFRLNMGELKMRQKAPMNMVGDKKDKVEKMQRPVRQINVQGYMPSMEGVVRPQAIMAETAAVGAPAPPGAPPRDEYQPSMADFTGIIVENSGGERPDSAADAAQ